jgi:DNA-binding transcriptional ArsR family regulator
LEIDAIIDGINHKIRRKIILLLAEHGPMKYSSLLSKLDIQSGVLNYHLTKMELLLKKDEERVYSLSDEGILAYKLLNFLKGEIGRPQVLSKPRKSSSIVLYEAALSIFDLLMNPRKAFTHKGTASALGSFCMGSLLFLISVKMGARTFIEVMLLFLANLLFTAGLSIGIYGVRIAKIYFLMNFLRTQLPEMILLLIKSAISSWIISFGELEYSLFLLGVRYIIQPALALWMFILLLFATKESTDLDLSKSFVVVILSLLVLRMIAKLFGFSQEIHVIMF